MNATHQRRETLQRLALRANRMLRIVCQDPPDLLVVREAILLLSAAAELSPDETRRELAAWWSANPGPAPEVFDLRGATVDRCIEEANEELCDQGVDISIASDVSERLAHLKVP